jgi:RluA family pseudouridine synthase
MRCPLENPAGLTVKVSPFTIVYEDRQIAAVNKASGISTAGERWEREAARLDRLLAENLGKNSAVPLFTVHRIDKETSGLVVFARDAAVHKTLSLAFETRAVKKIYTAVVHGRPSWPGGEISCDLPLVLDGNKRHMTIIDKYRGRASCTFFTLLFSAGNYSVVEALPLTGRTHQIRVHLAALGHPVVCDPLYGMYGKSSRGEAGVFLSSFKRGWRGDVFEERPLLARLGLHAGKLLLPEGFAPERGGLLEAPLPRDMAALIRQMKNCAV